MQFGFHINKVEIYKWKYVQFKHIMQPMRCTYVLSLSYLSAHFDFVMKSRHMIKLHTKSIYKYIYKYAHISVIKMILWLVIHFPKETLFYNYNHVSALRVVSIENSRDIRLRIQCIFARWMVHDSTISKMLARARTHARTHTQYHHQWHCVEVIFNRMNDYI